MLIAYKAAAATTVSHIPAHYVIVERMDSATGESVEVVRLMVHSAQREWWVNRFNLLVRERNLPYSARVGRPAPSPASPDDIFQDVLRAYGAPRD